MNHMITYQGHHINYQLIKNPTKPTILLLHGFLASTYCFRKLIPLLEKNYQLIAIDLPPFGKSEKSDSCLYSYDHMVDVISFILRTLDINKITIIGHSMGGQIALRYTFQYKEQIQHLFLLSPTSFMRKSHLFSRFICHNPFSPFIAHQLLKRKGVYEMLRHSMYHDQFITDEMLQQYKEPFLDKKIYPCLIKILNDHQGDLSEYELLNIHTPCTILWGKNDEIIPFTIGYELLRFLPNSSLTLLDKIGHLIPEEAPNYIAKKVKNVKH
ncbi:alpha/beta fold hydrolase [Gracilibacillus kekensis]|uniref:Pimeloyl-ACP methyl ester carboxylesterase n=1 Tax=Gracilibacillus kekensis TaxID=1027249 RepID=A0A1M7MM28_9BACI|nr:alpha/beta hydrolase [Gracilibacillus kekensis]SHM92006.1 Pimeloyl-ACP methyl ester carboxylesterase [Gracilibacillus kekensis]